MASILLLLPIMAIIIVPIAVVAVGSFWSAPFIRLAGDLTLDHYKAIFTGPNAGEIFITTATLTLGSSALALLLGGTQAWIIARTNVPFRSVLRWLPITPLLLSALVANFGWTALFSPDSGLVNDFLQDHLGFSGPVFNIYSMPGLIVALGTHLSPIPYMIMLGPLSSMSRSLDEASRASGARRLRTLWSVNLPLLRPALLSSFTLTAIVAAHAFETPVILGGPARIQTYVSEIYRSISADVNYSKASAQAMIYLALIGLLLWWNRRMTRNEAKFAVIAGKGHTPTPTKLGWTRWLGFAYIVLMFVINVVALVASNLFISLLPFYSKNAPIPPFSLVNYSEAFTTPRTMEALRNSLILATTVAVCAVVVASFLAILSYKTKMRGRRLAEEIGTLPVAFPPLVFSVAMLITFLSLPAFAKLYNTVYLLVLVLVVVFLPFALRVMGSGVISIDNSLMEASASSGARITRTIRTIVLPLLAVALTGAFALVFIFSFRELGGVALVTPPNAELLPTVIYGMWTTGHIPTLYALNMISLGVTVLAFLLMGGVAYFISRRVSKTRAMSQLDLGQIDELPSEQAARATGAPV